MKCAYYRDIIMNATGYCLVDPIVFISLCDLCARMDANKSSLSGSLI